MTFKIPVPIVDQVGRPYKPTEIEKDSVIEHIYCSAYIESSWVRSIVVNTQEPSGHPHQIVVQGFFMNDTNNPFLLCFRAGAPPVVASFSHEKLKESA